MSFKPGDVVELKSSSVAMTVESTSVLDDLPEKPTVEYAHVLWMDGSEVRNETFLADTLKPYEGLTKVSPASYNKKE